jgi:hypothetical protein
MAGRGGILRGLTITKTENTKAKSKKFFMVNFRFLCQCGRGFSSLGGRNIHLGMSSSNACSYNPRPRKKPRRPARHRPQNPPLQQAPVSDSDSEESPAVSGDVGHDLNVDDGYETEDPLNTPLGWKILLFIIIFHFCNDFCQIIDQIAGLLGMWMSSKQGFLSLLQNSG